MVDRSNTPNEVCGDRLPAYQPFTTDADIVLDPSLLTDQPALGDVMRDAGFVFTPGTLLLRTQRAPGVRLGVAALRTTTPEAMTAAVLTGYWRAPRASG